MNELCKYKLSSPKKTGWGCRLMERSVETFEEEGRRNLYFPWVGDVFWDGEKWNKKENIVINYHHDNLFLLQTPPYCVKAFTDK
ncbi:hypothetical protein CEXT_16361 [Caerostris extrusa]|uniref:Uncharacterized protein n=1 Tax=Caerostris extrusa TaxID=172846 RepID=A0AAV4P821_CAEEX|nr:hypothetical protein CEXT_16361 [Caerostris extrusa]